MQEQTANAQKLKKKNFFDICILWSKFFFMGFDFHKQNWKKLVFFDKWQGVFVVLFGINKNIV